MRDALGRCDVGLDADHDLEVGHAAELEDADFEAEGKACAEVEGDGDRQASCPSAWSIGQAAHPLATYAGHAVSAELVAAPRSWTLAQALSAKKHCPHAFVEAAAKR